MALRVLREMVRCEPERFHSYAELTILKLLEAHKDPVKEVLVDFNKQLWITNWIVCEKISGSAVLT